MPLRELGSEGKHSVHRSVREEWLTEGRACPNPEYGVTLRLPLSEQCISGAGAPDSPVEASAPPPLLRQKQQTGAFF